MDALLPLLFVGGLILVAVFAYLGHLQAKRRREEMAALAQSRGWTWTARDDRWASAFDGRPFGLGHSRRATNVLQGDHDGRPMVAFDYRYSTTETSSNGKGGTTTRTVHHPFSVITLRTSANFPNLEVGPEGFFTRMFDSVTGQDIDFEWEQFNRDFRVRCPDRKFASDVVHQQMMEFLVPHRDTAWALRGGTLIVARAGQHSIAQLDATLAFADGVVDRIPDFVWQQAGVQDPGAGSRG